ncbi:hypothetical protein [Rhizobium ruizarguesonis]|uniref:hypothetical protein n=1 Tax=Rhizobium ruizarguesonis TaxID=2081791 RepID=UPI001FE1D0D5|nr:hypothetical protein [Rhizobium ruizarguesonis]
MTCNAGRRLAISRPRRCCLRWPSPPSAVVAGTAVAAPLAIIEQPARRQQPTGTELEDSLHNDRQSKPLTQ